MRPRSALGLKYVELQPGTSKDDLHVRRHDPAQERLRAARVRGPLLDLRPEDAPAHPATPPTGFGDAFAGRGQSINRAIEALNPFFRALTPVMTNLSRPEHRARPVLPPDRPRVGAGRAGGAHAGAAVHRHGRHLRGDLGATRARSRTRSRRRRPTMDVSIRLVPRPAAVPRPTSPTSRAGCARRSPSCRARCRRSTAPSRSARRCCRKTVELNENLEDAFERARTTCSRTRTRCSRCKRPRHRARPCSRPAIEYIAPYQTVCNYFNYFIHPLGEAQSVVQSGPTGGGTVAEPEHEGAELAPAEQLRLARPARGRGTSRRARSRRARRTCRATTCSALYAPPYSPAIDAQGNADCQVGQNGYPNGAAQQRPLQARRPQDASDEHGLPIPARSARAATARSCRRQQPPGPRRAAPT